MNAPQIIFIVLATISGTINLMNHGEPKGENYNFFVWIFTAIIEISLLRWGGFFG